MKILFFNHTGTISGAEGVLLTTLRRLDRTVFEVVLVCPRASALTVAAEGQAVRVLAVDELKARFTWRADRFLGYMNSLRKVIAQLRALVRSEAPDLIHANSIRAGLAATLATAGLGVKVIWHVHDVLRVHPFSTAIRLVATLSNRVHIIAVSEAAAVSFRPKQAALRASRLPVDVLHNGIETGRFGADRAAGERVRHSLGVSSDRFVIGIVGQLTERKCQLELVQMFPAVLARIPRALLFIVGSPLFNKDHQYRDEILEAVQKHGLQESVMLLGQRTDMMALFNSLDVLVLNSRQEPFGTVLLEAMAAGIPVVSTNVGGSPEIIEHGVNGFLYPFGKPALLTERLFALWSNEDLRVAIANRGSATVRQRFTADTYIHKLESFYRSLPRTRDFPISSESREQSS
jgi:glycosyltransferase involved in cell wall biosynthesis